MILSSEVKQGVHAELQLLSKILIHKKATMESTVAQDVFQQYIGISKLCCLKCRITIEAAKAILKFKKSDIFINIRGQHDLNFQNWIEPKFLVNGFQKFLNWKESESLEDGDQKNPLPEDIAGSITLENIAHLIGFLAADCISNLNKKDNLNKVNMQADFSESDTDSCTEEKFLDAQSALEKNISFLQACLESNSAIERTLDEAQLAKKIFKIIGFRALYSEDFSLITIDVLKDAFVSISNKLRQNDPKLDQATCLNILQSAHLIGPLAKEFKNINLNDVLSSSMTSSSSTRTSTQADLSSLQQNEKKQNLNP